MSPGLGLQYFSNEAVNNDLISDLTKNKIDLEINRILEESYDRATNILKVKIFINIFMNSYLGARYHHHHLFSQTEDFQQQLMFY